MRVRVEKISYVGVEVSWTVWLHSGSESESCEEGFCLRSWLLYSWVKVFRTVAWLLQPLIQCFSNPTLYSQPGLVKLLLPHGACAPSKGEVMTLLLLSQTALSCESTRATVNTHFVMAGTISRQTLCRTQRPLPASCSWLFLLCGTITSNSQQLSLQVHLGL